MPAPTVAVGDVLIGVIKGTLFGQETQTTFHWKIENTDGINTVQTLCTEMIDEILPDFVTMISDEWVSRVCYARRVHPNPTRGFELSTAAVAGTVVAASLPPSVAGVISRFTNLPGPGGRGRIFVPGVPTSWHEDGLLSAAGLAAYSAFLPHLDLQWDPGNGTVYEPVLYKGGGVAVNIENAVARSVLRSQRRREIGVGI